MRLSLKNFSSETPPSLALGDCGKFWTERYIQWRDHELMALLSPPQDEVRATFLSTVWDRLQPSRRGSAGCNLQQIGEWEHSSRECKRWTASPKHGSAFTVWLCVWVMANWEIFLRPGQAMYNCGENLQSSTMWGQDKRSNVLQSFQLKVLTDINKP